MALQRRAEVMGAHVRQMRGTGFAVALDQRQDRVHVALSAMLDLGEGTAAHKGHVRLDGLAFAAERGGVVTRLHDLADAVHEEPSGFHAAIEGPLYLAGGNALFRPADELDGLQPQMQREMAIFEDRTDTESERLAAGIAL